VLEVMEVTAETKDMETTHIPPLSRLVKEDMQSHHNKVTLNLKQQDTALPPALPLNSKAILHHNNKAFPPHNPIKIRIKTSISKEVMGNEIPMGALLMPMRCKVSEEVKRWAIPWILSLPRSQISKSEYHRNLDGAYHAHFRLQYHSTDR
jgi:hypothetical protein